MLSAEYPILSTQHSALSTQLNLLFLTPQLPHPPRQGTAIRNWGLIKSLAARHAISLLTFAGEGDSITPELRAACRRIETAPTVQRPPFQRLRNLLLSPLPDLAHRLESPEFSARLGQLINTTHFDTLFVEGLELAAHSFTAEYAGNAGRITKNNFAPSALSAVKIIFDAHNCETVLQRRAFATDRRSPRRWPAAFYSLIQSRRLARFEAEVCRRADQVTCVSAKDAQALQTLVPDLTPVVIPNGIFLSDYTQIQLPLRITDYGLRITNNQPALVFTGKMDYRPNVDAALWFANDILPLIHRERPAAQFVIVGQKPAAAVRRLAGRTGVVVAGAVADIRPHIAGAAVYVAPLRMGGGTRFKLLEAMALRKPIVSTTLGAEGFDLQPGRELLLADSAADFAQAVLTLLGDPARQQALAAAAFEFVKGYDWGEITPRVEGVLSPHKRLSRPGDGGQ